MLCRKLMRKLSRFDHLANTEPNVITMTPSSTAIFAFGYTCLLPFRFLLFGLFFGVPLFFSVLRFFVHAHKVC